MTIYDDLPVLDYTVNSKMLQLVAAAQRIKIYVTKYKLYNSAKWRKTVKILKC